MRRTAVVLLSVVLAGCGGEQGADVAPGLARLVMTPGLTIGSVDGTDALSDVTGVFEAPSGELYVTQFSDATVRVFGADGALVRQIGRRGQGPADFMAPGPVGLLGDSLWVSDGPQGRVTLFGPDGDVARVVTINRPLDGVEGCTLRAGSYLAPGVLWTRPDCNARLITEGQVASFPVVAMREDGVVTNTIAVIPAGTQAAQVRMGDTRAFVSLANIGAPAFASARGAGIFVRVFAESGAGGGRIRAAWLNAQGDTVGRSEAAYSPRPFSAADRDGTLEPHLEQMRRIPGYDAEVFRTAALEQVPWPSDWPAFTQALVGPDTRLWLRREEGGDSVRWEVWAPDVGPIAEAWLPAGLEVEYVGTDHLWGVRKGDMDVPYLVRYSF